MWLGVAEWILGFGSCCLGATHDFHICTDLATLLACRGKTSDRNGASVVPPRCNHVVGESTQHIL